VNSTIRLSAGLVAAAVLATACGGRSLTAPPAPIPALSAAADRSGGAMSLAYPAYPEPGRVEYRVQGTLPGLAAKAAAYRLAATATAEQVSRLASALGVNGTVGADASGWTVTGSGSTLRVQRTGGLPWMLAQTGGSSVGISGCAVAMPAGPASAPGRPPAGSAGVPGTVAPPPCPVPTAVPGLPSRAEAEQLARTDLSRAGLDLQGAVLDTSGGIGEWFVSVIPAVGGVPVGAAAWSMAVGPHGSLLTASGWLAGPASAGDYPLVGVPAGLDRLRAGGTWILRGGPGGPGPMPMMGASSGLNAASQGSPVQVAPLAPLPPACVAGPACPTPTPPPPTIVTVTGVHLGLAWGTPAGSNVSEAWLVPVYVFELGGGGTVPVLAVADRFITPPSAVPPVKILPEPLPLPAQPPNQAPAPAPASTGPSVGR
jgi:hypothetical protein